MDNLYYTPPSDDIFLEVKSKVMAIWRSYDNTYGYVDEKVDKIKDLENVSDNFMFMIAMLDFPNQIKLAVSLSEQAKKEVGIRIKAGGASDSYNPFIHL